MSNRSSIRILNRDGNLPQDDWYMVAKKGEHAIAVQENGKTVTFLQIVDDAACASMLNRFNETRAADPLYEPLVDYDHFSEDTDKPSEAAGWIKALENRADGLYAQIQWTDRGLEAVAGRRYRFLSPVWSRADCEALGNRRVRPLKLDRAAVTNDPNIKGMAPLVNRTAPATPGERESTMDYKAKLLAMLGLPAEATDDEITAACDGKNAEMENACREKDALANRAAAAEEALALANRREVERLVEFDLEEFKAAIVDREQMKAQLLANRDATRKVLANLNLAREVAQEPLRNRQDATPPAPTATEDEKLANRRQAQDDYIGDIQEKMRCPSRAAAYDIARARKPELFA